MRRRQEIGKTPDSPHSLASSSRTFHSVPSARFRTAPRCISSRLQPSMRSYPYGRSPEVVDRREMLLHAPPKLRFHLLLLCPTTRSFPQAKPASHSPPSTTYLNACFSPQGIGTSSEKLPSGCFLSGVAVSDQLLKPPATWTWGEEAAGMRVSVTRTGTMGARECKYFRRVGRWDGRQGNDDAVGEKG
jgi:hypothetical protein